MSVPPDDACALIERITYKPTWRFTAQPYPQYQDTVRLEIEFETPNTDHPPRYESLALQSQWFYLHVADCATPLDVWGLVLECVLHLEVHELREFFAVDDAYTKPFHAHTSEGIANWFARRPLGTQRDLADVTILRHVDASVERFART